MGTQVGLTQAQALKLISLATESGQKAKVRTANLDASQHRGRAFLLEVVNRHQALIQPFEHRKQELVELSSLSFWKSGNDFDISEAINAVEQKEEIMASANTSRYVVYSKKWNGVWGGDHKKWVPQSNRARLFDTQESAQEVADKQAKSPMSSDAVAMRLEEAHSLLNPTPMPIAIEPTAEAVTHMPKQLNSLFDSDLDAILNFDKSALMKAIDECQQAAKDLQQVEALRIEAEERLQKAKELVSQMTSMVGKAARSQKQKSVVEDEASVPTKPGALKKAILEACGTKSHWDTTSLFNAIRQACPKSSEGSIQQALYKLRADGLIAGSNAAGWNLVKDK